MSAGKLFTCAIAILSGTSYSADWMLDTQFGYNGVVVSSGMAQQLFYPEKVTIQADGKIVTGGSVGGGSYADFVINRFYPGGAIDYGFGANGRVSLGFYTGGMDFGRKIALAPDGSYVVSGEAQFKSGISSQTNNDFGLARVSTSSAIVFKKSYAISPNYRNDAMNDMDVQPDGKILLVGSSIFSTYSDAVVARYATNGNPDTGFANSGVFSLDASFGLNDLFQSVKHLSNGKVLACGSSYEYGYPAMILIRLNPNGTIDQTFGNAGRTFLRIQNSSIFCRKIIESYGRYYVFGNASSTNPGPSMFVAAFNSGGYLDTTFGVAGVDRFGNIAYNDNFGDVILSVDNRFTFVYQTNDTGSNWDIVVHKRYLSGGADNLFNNLRLDFSVFDTPKSLVQQASNRIIIAGSSGSSYVYSQYGSGVFAMARIFDCTNGCPY